MNNTCLVGRLTRDPELRHTANNIAVANFTVAINRPFKTEDGESEADFINCVAWRDRAENTAKFCRKGDMIGVVGRLQTRSYDDNEGNRRFITEVVCENVQFLEPKKDDTAKEQPTPSKPKPETPKDDYNDGLPF